MPIPTSCFQVAVSILASHRPKLLNAMADVIKYFGKLLEVVDVEKLPAVPAEPNQGGSLHTKLDA